MTESIVLSDEEFSERIGVLDSVKLSFEDDVLSFENDGLNVDTGDVEVGTVSEEEEIEDEEEELSKESLDQVYKWLKQVISYNVRNDVTTYAKQTLKRLQSSQITYSELNSALEEIKNTFNAIVARRKR